MFFKKNVCRGFNADERIHISYPNSVEKIDILPLQTNKREVSTVFFFCSCTHYLKQPHHQHSQRSSVSLEVCCFFVFFLKVGKLDKTLPEINLINGFLFTSKNFSENCMHNTGKQLQIHFCWIVLSLSKS